MASRIRMQTGGMQEASNKLKVAGNEFEDLLQDVEQVISALPESWEGEAARAYAQQYDNLKPGLSSVRQLFQDIATQIDQALSEMAETDKNIASRIR